jgi:ubiquinone/menaquinone biosynthesis C-methylase UbiE
MNNTAIDANLKIYLKNRPALLAPLRAKEAYLFQVKLPLKGPVLDIGCGDGFFAEVIFGHNSRAVDVALDIEGSRIDQTKATGVYKRLATYDGKTMPFKNGTFGTVISNSTLEHITDLDSVLRETNRVLKRDGTFITTVVAKPWADHYFGNRITGNNYKKWMTDIQVHINLFTDSQWDKAFKKAGFRIVKKTGHAGPLISTWTDILHYAGIGNLLSYKLFGKWVLFPGLADKLFPVKYFSGLAAADSETDRAVCIYYELKPGK